MRAPQVVMLALSLSAFACAGSVRQPRSWAQLSRAEKNAFMRDTVMPEMEKIFSRWDAHRYPKITCVTCHAHDGFAMPNAELLLEPEAVNGAEPMNRFMREQVTPAMARLLGRPSYDCFGCHTRDL